MHHYFSQRTGVEDEPCSGANLGIQSDETVASLLRSGIICGSRSELWPGSRDVGPENGGVEPEDQAVSVRQERFAELMLEERAQALIRSSGWPCEDPITSVMFFPSGLVRVYFGIQWLDLKQSDGSWAIINGNPELLQQYSSTLIRRAEE
jgi:hypothetical protein